jgi:hypothetical protein
MAHAPEQGHNHNLDSIALNYPCPISRLRVISHNRTKCRENGTREQNYFLSIMSMQVYNTPLGSWMGTGPPPLPCGGQGVRHRCFLRWWWAFPDLQLRDLPGGLPLSLFTSMVGALGSPSTPPRVVHHWRFLTLMVSAPGSLVPTPPRGAHCRRFLALMVGTPGSPALAPPRGLAIDIFLRWWWVLLDLYQHPSGGPSSMFLCIDDWRSQIFSTASQGACHWHPAAKW